LGENGEEDFEAGGSSGRLHRNAKQIAAEVDKRAHNARVLRRRKERLQKHYLAEDSHAVEPNEQPDEEQIRVLHHVGDQDGPSECRQRRRYAQVVHKPGEPVGQVTHAHHSHCFFRTRLLFFHNEESHVVHGRNEHKQNEEGQELLQDLLK